MSHKCIDIKQYNIVIVIDEINFKDLENGDQLNSDATTFKIKMAVRSHWTADRHEYC